MIRWVFSTFFSIACFQASALPSKDNTIKVETQAPQKKENKKQSYPYDSIESDNTKIEFSASGFWSQKPKLLLMGGFHADKAFFEMSQSKRLFAGAGLHFRHRNWHRWNINAIMIQNNNFLLSGSWEYTPSRKQLRTYYGLGLSHLMISQKEFRNFLETSHYFITASTGIEYLLESNQGLTAEVKVFLGLESYALQLLIGYIIPL